MSARDTSARPNPVRPSNPSAIASVHKHPQRRLNASTPTAPRLLASRTLSSRPPYLQAGRARNRSVHSVRPRVLCRRPSAPEVRDLLLLPPRLIALALVRSSGPRLRAIVVVFPRVIPWGLWSGLHAPIRGGFFEFRLGLLRISVGSSWIACRREKEVGCFGPS